MAHLTIYIPDEQEPFKEDLRFFIEMMARKLHANRHKGFADGVVPREMLKRVYFEAEEAQEKINAGQQFEAVVEAADVANFAFLFALACMRMTKPEFKRANENADS